MQTEIEMNGLTLTVTLQPCGDDDFEIVSIHTSGDLTNLLTDEQLADVYEELKICGK